MKKGNLSRYNILILFAKNTLKNLSKSAIFCLLFYLIIANIKVLGQDNTGIINVDNQGEVGLTGDNSINNGVDSANRAEINVNYSGSSASGDFATAIQGDNATNGQYGTINIIGKYGLGIVGNNASLVSGSELNVSGENAVGIDASGSSGNTIFADNTGTINVTGKNAIGVKGQNYIYNRQNFINLSGDGAIALSGTGMQVAKGVNLFLRGDNVIGIQGTGSINNGVINYGTGFDNMVAISGDSAINNGTINVAQKNGTGIIGDNAQNNKTINASYLGSSYDDAAIGVEGDGFVNKDGGLINVSGMYAIGVKGDNATLEEGSQIVINSSGVNGIGVYGDNVIHNGGTITVHAQGGRAIVGTGGLDVSNDGNVNTTNTGTLNINYNMADSENLNTNRARGIHGDNTLDGSNYRTTNAASGVINVNGDYAAGIDGDNHINEGNINIGSGVVRSFSATRIDYTEHAVGIIGDNFVNKGTITVAGQYNTGIEGDGTINEGTITVGGKNNIGIKGDDTNNAAIGIIDIQSYNSKGIFIEDGGIAINEGTITASGSFSRGIEANNSTVINKGTITASGGTAKGIYADNDSIVTNTGTIIASGDYYFRGVEAKNKSTATNTGTITTSGEYSKGLLAWINSTATNKGTITTSGKSSYGMIALRNSTAINKETIIVSGENSTGIMAAYSAITNDGTINITGSGKNSIGIMAIDSTITNNGTINIAGNGSSGIIVEEGAVAINNGTINATHDNSRGISITNSTVTNNGTINAKHYAVELKGNSSDSSTFTNTGTLNSESGHAIHVIDNDFTINLEDRLVPVTRSGQMMRASTIVGSTAIGGSNLNGNIVHNAGLNSTLNINSSFDDEFAVINADKINKSNTGTWYVRDATTGTNLASNANQINLTSGGINLRSDLNTNSFNMSNGTLSASNTNQLKTDNLTISGGTLNTIFDSNYGVNGANRVISAPIFINDNGTANIGGPINIRISATNNVDLSKPLYIIGEGSGVTSNIDLSNMKIINNGLTGQFVTNSNGVQLKLAVDLATANNFVAQGLQMQRNLVQQFQDDIHYYLITNIELTDAKGIDPNRDETGLAIWTRGVNYYARERSGAGKAGYSSVAGGILAGIDQRIGDGLVGIYGGWANNSTSFKGSGYGSSGLNQDIIQFGMYGSYTFLEQFYTTAITNFNYGFNDLSTYRGLNNDQRSTANYGSLGVGGQMRLGYRQEFELIDILPEVGFNYQWMHSQSTTEESGERIFQLKYKDINKNFVDGVFGLRLAKSYRINDDFILTPNFSAHWVQGFNGNSVGGDVSNDLGQVAHVTANTSPWAIATEAGMGIEWNGDVQFNMAYKGRYNDDLLINGFFATVSYTFSDLPKQISKLQELLDQ